MYWHHNEFNQIKYYIYYYIKKNSPPILYPFILKYFIKKFTGKDINLKNPITFSDKINYIKLYEDVSKKTILSDKIRVKEYVKTHVPELKFAKIYQIASSFDDLNLEICPNTFLIKTNHACKTNVLVEDKTKLKKEDYIKYSKYFNKVLKINYAYWGTFEMQYKYIEPKVFIEENLNYENSEFTIKEYEVYCFNGEPEFINVRAVGEADGPTWYLPNWEIAGFDLFMKYERHRLPFVNHKDELLKYSRILSSGFTLVRIDFFEVNNTLYFGEMTFSPLDGRIKFVPDSYDLILGQKLKLNQ